LIYAILYDKITTLNEPTPESPWTVSRLTPTLSSLSPAHLNPSPTGPTPPLPPLKQIKIAVLRRSLTYPLYRTLPFSEKVWSESATVLKGGKRGVIRLFLEARGIFMEGDWSLYSRIVWEDYITWLQAAKDRVLGVLGEEMLKVHVGVEEIGFGLKAIHEELEE
jgi:protein SHQ1